MFQYIKAAEDLRKTKAEGTIAVFRRADALA